MANFVLSGLRLCECNLCIYRWTKRLLHLLFGVQKNHSLGQATRHENSDPFTHFIQYRSSFTANHFGDKTGRVPKLILKQRFVYAFVGLKNMSIGISKLCPPKKTCHFKQRLIQFPPLGCSHLKKTSKWRTHAYIICIMCQLYAFLCIQFYVYFLMKVSYVLRTTCVDIKY